MQHASGMKITWSSDPNVAERQMQAIIFCLVAFGYIDSDFDLAFRHRKYASAKAANALGGAQSVAEGLT